jgi:hypothetical protein
MAYKNASSQNGIASYNQYFQLNTTQIAALTAQEGLDADAFDLAGNKGKYGVLTWQVNSVPVNLSGDINVDGTITGYDHVNEAQVNSDHELLVIDNSMLIESQYSRIIQEFGTDTYIAHAPISTTISTSGWRVQKIDAIGSKQWADGGAFSQPANVALSGLSFSY